MIFSYYLQLQALLLCGDFIFAVTRLSINENCSVNGVFFFLPFKNNQASLILFCSFVAIFVNLFLCCVGFCLLNHIKIFWTVNE